jgi:hypothetical protein
LNDDRVSALIELALRFDPSRGRGHGFVRPNKRLDEGWAAEAALATPPRSRREATARILVRASGEEKGAVDWARDRRCKVSTVKLLARLARGIPPEIAISAAPFRLAVRR